MVHNTFNYILTRGKFIKLYKKSLSALKKKKLKLVTPTFFSPTLHYIFSFKKRFFFVCKLHSPPVANDRDSDPKIGQFVVLRKIVRSPKMTFCQFALPLLVFQKPCHRSFTSKVPARFFFMSISWLWPGSRLSQVFGSEMDASGQTVFLRCRMTNWPL